MARTITQVERTIVVGDLKMRVVDVDITNYQSGGEDVTPTDLGFARRAVGGFAEVIGTGTATTGMEGVSAQYQPDDDKLKIFHSGGSDGEMAEMTGSANEGTEVRIVAFGV